MTASPAREFRTSLLIKKRTVQLQEEGLILQEITNHLKVSPGIIHKTLEVYGEYGKYMNPSKADSVATDLQ